MRNNPRRENLNRLRAQQDNDWFFDKWETDFDKTAKKAFRFGLGAWVGFLVLNLVIWGVVIWAIIELVQWVTAK